MWQQLCKRLGIKQVSTTAYHPQANGMVERAHRQLKDTLRAREAGADWPDHLEWVLLGLRAAPKEHVFSPAFFGQPLILPGELTGVPESAAEDFHVYSWHQRILHLRASQDPMQQLQPLQLQFPTTFKEPTSCM